MRNATIALFTFIAALVITAFALVPDEKQPICHVPPGNPENARTIYPDDSAYNAHLNHSEDYFGECRTSSTTTQTSSTSTSQSTTTTSSTTSTTSSTTSTTMMSPEISSTSILVPSAEEKPASSPPPPAAIASAPEASIRATG